MIKYSKDILIYKVSKKIEIYNEEEKKQIAEIAEKASKEELINIIYKLSELENKMRMSSQKTIIFETEIIKLCIKVDVLSLEDRISKLEKEIESGEIQIKSINATEIPQIIKKEETTNIEEKHWKEAKDLEKVKTEKEEKPKEAKQEENIKPKENKKITISEGTTIREWQTILKKIKEQGKVIVYANLINTEAVIVNDMTVTIRFNNGLTDFRQKLLTQPENLSLLTKEISIICGKTMQVKLEDTKGIKKPEAKKEIIKETKEAKEILKDDDLAGLINYIEEE